MSQPESILEESGYEGLEEWTTAAVRGANNWLVMLRNATDEGISPWSDEYTEGKNGIMTYSEGLIAQALVKAHVPNIEEDPDWDTLRPRFFETDLGFVLEKADNKNFESAPYLIDEDDEPITQDFTPAATFTASAIIESLRAGIDFGVEDSEIEDALEDCLDWLLTNKIEGDNVDTDDAAGWAWVGSDSDDYEDVLTKSVNYFTYSAVLVLCDLYGNRQVDIIDSVVSKHEDRLEETIKQANEYLLNEHWDENKWTMPTTAGQAALGEELLSSCYAFVGLSYIAYTVEDIDLTERHRERMGKTIDWALTQYEEQQRVWGLTVEYDCGQEDTFTDGSVPYVLLDALLELVNYRNDVIDYVDGFDKETVERKIRNDVTPTVLQNCWAGDQKFETKGFRHIQYVERLLEYDDGDPENNMTAIYSTGVAIETFLLNFLEQGNEIVKRERKATSTTDTGSESAEGQPQAMAAPATTDVDKTTIILNDEGASGEYDDEDIENIHDQLAEIKSEVEQIPNEVSDEVDGTGGMDPAELDVRSLEFVTALYDLRRTLRDEYDNHWDDDVCEDLGKAGDHIPSVLQKNWDDKFRRKNEEQFLAYLSALYFCSDRETYEEMVKIPEADATFLLPPQRAIVDEVEEWGDEDFADTDARKTFVEEAVTDLTEEPWSGEDITQVMVSFKNRYAEEAL